MGAVQIENLAILLTDIKGYTAKTSQQTRAESQAWLFEHEALLLPVIEGFGGQRRKGIGDAIIATFPSPTNAALAAIAIQDRLWSYNRQVPDKDRVEVRAVLNLGEVNLSGGELLGEAAAVLTKLDKFAGSGEVIFTEALYLAMNKAEVPARELGIKQLEGLSEPLKLFRAQRTGEGDEWPPYGGRALTQLSALPAIDPQWIGTLKRDPKAALRRERSLVQRGGRRRWQMAAIAAGAAIVAFGVIELAGALRSPVRSIEALIEAGKAAEAKAAIARHLQAHPDRIADGHYLHGRLALAEGKVEQAALGFQKAIAADDRYRGEERIRQGMEAALEDESCDARSQAAKTLGILGDRAARPALEAALERQRSQSNFLTGLFCRFESHAQEALQKLE